LYASPGTRTSLLNQPATTEIYPLSLHDALPICTFGSPRVGDFSYALRHGQAVPTSHRFVVGKDPVPKLPRASATARADAQGSLRSEEHTSELQSLRHLVCRLLLEKKKIAI